MAVVFPNAGRSRIPAVRDIVLLLVVGFLVLQQGLPQLGVFAQEASSPQANTVLGNGFTYQGRLNLAGVPANGQFDFEFALFDQMNGGLAAGTPSTVLRDNVEVTEGLFVAELDFGPTAFQGSERFLEVRVRPGASTGLYDPLTPRQELTPTPYALFSKASDWSGITNKPALQPQITGNCATGSSIRVVNGDGSVLCETDDVGAGGGGGDHAGETWTSSSFKTLFGLTNTSTCTGGGDWCYGLSANGGASIGGIGLRAEGGNTGVWGVSPIYGVFGTSTAAGGFGALGQGETGVRAIGTSVGVEASGDDYGMRATSSNIGLKSTGSEKGVYAEGRIGLEALTTGHTGDCDSPGDSYCYGVYAASYAPAGLAYGGIGAFGYGANTGVWGTGGLVGVNGHSDSGVGVAGTGEPGVHGAGTSVGVFGTAATIGVHGTASSIGVKGEGLLVGMEGFGRTGVFGSTFGQNDACDTFGEGFCYGAWGTSRAPSGDGYGGIGVYGDGTNTGVWGKGDRYGVYGEMKVGGIAAGYFVGPVVGTSFSPPSDIRLKKNISASTYGLSEVMRFNSYSYDLISLDDGRHLGLIAQDVREIVPEVVREITSPEGDSTLVLNYNELIPVLINAIQEQQAQIQGLQSTDYAGDVRQAPAAVAMTATASSTGNAAIGIAIASMLMAVGSLSGTAIVLRRRR